jgi:PAS domain S-box-containing protein
VLFAAKERAAAAAFSRLVSAFPVLLLGTSLGLALSFAMGWAVARRSRKALRLLTQATERVAHGDLSGPVPTEGMVELSSLALSFNRMVGVLRESMVSRDELKVAVRHWYETFDALEEVIVGLDERGRIRRINRAGSSLLGIEPDVAMGLDLRHEGAPEPFGVVARLIREGKPTVTKVEAGGRTWLLSLAEVAGASGADMRFLAVARDISEIVKLEGDLLRKETMATLGSLVSGVAHEVRNPLFAISALVDTLAEENRENPDFGEYGRRLRQEVGRLGALMQDLLDYGRPLAPELRPTDLRLIADQSIQACAMKASSLGVRVRNMVPSDLPRVPADPDRLMQVFQNLVENSISVSPQGSTVELMAESERHDGRRWVICSVLDSGPGFQACEISRVFEPFYTRRRGGTGLGLAIARSIVEAHHGQICAGNREEGGALVSVRIPA